MVASLVGLKGSGDVCREDGKATPSSPVKCPGMHCCYSTARLQMSGHALCLLQGRTSNVQTCLGVHCCYSAARLQMPGHALHLLHGQTSNVWACIAVTPWPDFKCLSGCALCLLHGQTHWSPGRYWIHFHRSKLNLTKIDLTIVKALMS